MKVGDYVRTDDYGIRKISGFISDLENDYIECNDENNRIIINKKSIIKSSPNIIDLIEVGDYVNGCPVLHKEENEVVCGLLLRYKEKDIKSIVTKQEFESMEYKVGE